MSMMRELNFFLRFQIKQTKKKIFINQSKYVKKLIKKYEMKTIRPLGHPSTLYVNLTKMRMTRVSIINFYRGLIRSLLYFIANRPDIIFNICMYTKYQTNPRESYLLAIKRILRILII